MQSLGWDNYQYVLAIHRCHTLAAAARSLGVNETTVSRRLVQTEKFLKLQLFSRRSNGLVATDKGLKLIHRLERVKFELNEAQSELATTLSEIGGVLRVAGDLLLLNNMLVPSLHQLLDKNPALACDLVTVGSGDPLKDCDVALRFSDSMSTVDLATRDNAVLMGSIEFGVFASANCDSSTTADSIPWLVRSEEANYKSLGVPHSNEEGSSVAGIARVRATSDETLLSCLHAGLGKCLLPMGVGMRHPLLALLQGTEPCPSRDIVRVCQPELIGTGRLAACDEWLLHCVDSFNSPNG